MHKITSRPYTSAVDRTPSLPLTSTDADYAGGRPVRTAKRGRHRSILDLVASQRIANQHEFVALLAVRGIDVTQATVSRDITELGLVKIAVDGQHVYAPAGLVAGAVTTTSDARLRRALSDYPVRVGRSGLTLLLVSEAATGAAIAEAIDDSTFETQEGTLAGDNTVLVLFADEARLVEWQSRFEALLGSVEPPR
jgi:transcriptional regulator of arginine metabolism